MLTDLILKAQLPIGIFSLETGRLHKETLAMLDKVKEHYGYDIALFRPEPQAVDQYVAQNGLNAFYDSVEMRRECCRIRKVEPLGRALAGNKAWITGQCRAQSNTRSSLAVHEDDPALAVELAALAQELDPVHHRRARSEGLTSTAMTEASSSSEQTN